MNFKKLYLSFKNTLKYLIFDLLFSWEIFSCIQTYSFSSTSRTDCSITFAQYRHILRTCTLHYQITIHIFFCLRLNIIVNALKDSTAEIKQRFLCNSKDELFARVWNKTSSSRGFLNGIILKVLKQLNSFLILWSGECQFWLTNVDLLMHMLESRSFIEGNLNCQPHR